MNKPAKLKATFLLTLMISMSLLLILNSTIAMAQDNQAEVIIVDSVGGSTDPVAGTYKYNENETINIAATPSDGFEFKYWIFQILYTSATNQPPVVIPEDEEPFPQLPSSTQLAQEAGILTQNPLALICGYGYTIMYQAVFVPTTPTVPGQGLANNAIVTVLASTGGTTSPTPGTYTYANGTAINLKATANDGFEFKYWIITATYIVGENQPQVVIPEDEEPWPQLPSPSQVASVNVVDTNANLQVLCGYGYSVNYQAVFAPTGSGVTPPGEEPSGTSSMYLYVAIAVVAIIAVIGFALAYMYMKKSKTPK